MRLKAPAPTPAGATVMVDQVLVVMVLVKETLALVPEPETAVEEFVPFPNPPPATKLELLDKEEIVGVESAVL